MPHLAERSDDALEHVAAEFTFRHGLDRVARKSSASKLPAPIPELLLEVVATLARRAALDLRSAFASTVMVWSFSITLSFISSSASFFAFSRVRAEIGLDFFSMVRSSSRLASSSSRCLRITRPELSAPRPSFISLCFKNILKIVDFFRFLIKVVAESKLGFLRFLGGDSTRSCCIFCATCWSTILLLFPGFRRVH